MAGNVVEFTDANFQTDVLESDQPVLVDFWAPWCGPCRMLAPTIDQIGEEYAGRARVGKLNTDDNPRVASEYQVSAIPTVLLFKNGQPVKKFVGVTPKDQFATALNSHLG
jgi:thioredoxin 1